MKVVAVAGRRIDPANAEVVRFPLARVEAVREHVRTWLKHLEATAVISSGACGADLIAQEVAGELGLRRIIVLPFDRERFRATSVTDRPGNWGPLYDAICDDAAAMGDLVVMSLDPDDAATYERASDEIVSLAAQLAEAAGDTAAPGVAALVIWDGVPRGSDDVTAAFDREARVRGMSVIVISTLPERE